MQQECTNNKLILSQLKVDFDIYIRHIKEYFDKIGYTDFPNYVDVHVSLFQIKILRVIS